MTLLRKRLFLASAAGFSLSVLLAALEALRHRDIWMILQFPGFLAGASIWGVHSGGNSFEAVMVVGRRSYLQLSFPRCMRTSSPGTEIGAENLRSIDD